MRKSESLKSHEIRTGSDDSSKAEPRRTIARTLTTNLEFWMGSHSCLLSTCYLCGNHMWFTSDYSVADDRHWQWSVFDCPM